MIAPYIYTWFGILSGLAFATLIGVAYIIYLLRNKLDSIKPVNITEGAGF